jgi:hypothetical protein
MNKAQNLSIQQIIDTRVALDAKTSKTPEERTVSNWLAEAFDSMVPGAADALDRVFGSDFAGSYGEAMQIAYREVTA